MDNKKGRWLLSILLSFLFLTFLFFLLNAAPLIYADLPPLDSGSLPFAPLPGANAPPGGGFFPQFGAPYGFPYQNTGPGFMPPTGQFGLPSQAPGLGFMPPAGQFGAPYQAPGFISMPPPGQFGAPYQIPGSGIMPPGFMSTGAPYGFPTQTPGYNMPPSAPYAPINPYMQPSYDPSGANTTFPVYNTGYNPAAFPNQAFYGPAPNMYAPINITQQSPGLSAYDPTAAAQGFINPAAGFSTPFGNPYAAPYGNMALFPGAFPQQGYMGLPNMGYNPFQPVQPWSPYGTNINPYQQTQPWWLQQYGTNINPYPDDTEPTPTTPDPPDLPDALGYWAGTWEMWLTDPNEGVVTDPNGPIIITQSGDILFHITDQETDPTNMSISGTIEISGWDVPQPQNWPGNWIGESDVVDLTGWISSATRYLKARYFYYPGQEDSGDYDKDEAPINAKGIYTWYFNTNKLNITDTGISGQFSITGTNGYYEIGVFSTGKYQPSQ